MNAWLKLWYLYHIEDEVPECSLEGTAEDIRMAKHSHWR